MIAALVIPNAPDDVRLVTSCADVPRPPAPIVMDFDSAPPVYALPESNVLEPGIIARDGGLEYTFADHGTVESFECPEAPGFYYHVRTYQRVASSAFPRCWKLVTETERTGDCKRRPSIYDPSPDDAPMPDVEESQ